MVTAMPVLTILGAAAAEAGIKIAHFGAENAHFLGVLGISF